MRYVFNALKNALLKFFSFLVKANYHENDIYDNDGNVIGQEFFTTRGGKVFRKIHPHNNNDE
jgi:hypothetical protein